MEKNAARIINNSIANIIAIIIEGTEIITNIVYWIVVIWFPRFLCRRSSCYIRGEVPSRTLTLNAAPVSIRNVWTL